MSRRSSISATAPRPGTEPEAARIDPSSLLDPRSIAVVGASERPGAYGEIVLANLRRCGFAGPVWAVNPRHAGAEVMGRPCVGSVGELPEPVDAVVVAIPAAGVPAAVAEAAATGCGGAIVISAGFAEAAGGAELQEELRSVALAAGMPVCGPNGNGVCALPSGAAMWGDTVGARPAGGVAMITQSGNVGVNALGSVRGIDFHTLVSTGNGAVLRASDWLEALARREGVRSVAMFCEDEDDGASLARALAACAEREIGVAVLKVGSSEAGARAAAAHTGSLAGDARVFAALVEEAGGAIASDPHELLELARVLAEPRARPAADRGGGLAILTCSGGDSGIAADAAAREGITLPPLAGSTKAALEPILPAAATIDNPLDYTSMAWGEVETLRRMIEVVGADPGIAQMLLFYDHPKGPKDASWDRVREGIIAGAGLSSAAVLVASTLPDLIDVEAVGELADRGVPTVAGLGTAIRCAAALRHERGDPGRLRAIADAAAGRPPTGGGGEAEWLDEIEAKALLAGAGVEVPAGRAVTDAATAIEAATALGYPVALKLAAPGLLHKSEAGAIELGLAGPEALAAAFERLAALPAAAGGRILIERMAPAGAELVIAARAGGVVPSLVVGLGGIWAEALDDVAIVPLPADPARVERAIRSLRGAGLLSGARGREPLDVAAAARIGAAVGELLLSGGLDLVELNPVLVGPDGAVAVDAVAGGRAQSR